MKKNNVNFLKNKYTIAFLSTLVLAFGISLSYSFSNTDTNLNQNVAKAAALSNTEFSILAINCESVLESATTTNCKFDLPPTFTLPTGFSLGLEGSSSFSTSCTTSGVMVTCATPIGTGFGLKKVNVKVGSSAAVLNDSNVYIQPSSKEFATAEFTYSPTKGASAPLFRSSTPVSVTVRNFKTNLDSTPAASTYKCTIQARQLQPKSNNATWQTLGSNIDYNPTTGCTAQFAKSIRGSGLNWSIRANIIKTSDTTQSYNVFDSFVYRFEGAGSASGN